MARGKNREKQNGAAIREMQQQSQGARVTMRPDRVSLPKLLPNKPRQSFGELLDLLFILALDHDADLGFGA